MSYSTDVSDRRYTHLAELRAERALSQKNEASEKARYGPPATFAGFRLIVQAILLLLVERAQ